MTRWVMTYEEAWAHVNKACESTQADPTYRGSHLEVLAAMTLLELAPDDLGALLGMKPGGMFFMLTQSRARISNHRWLLLMLLSGTMDAMQYREFSIDAHARRAAGTHTQFPDEPQCLTPEQLAWIGRNNQLPKTEKDQ